MPDRELADDAIASALISAYLLGLEDGLQLPMAGGEAARGVVKMIRSEEVDRVLGRVMRRLKEDMSGPEDKS